MRYVSMVCLSSDATAPMKLVPSSSAIIDTALSPHSRYGLVGSP